MHTKILVFAVLLFNFARAGFCESTRCGDSTFIRRVYLDLTGTLPTAQEARTFLADVGPNRRAILVDKLLDSPEFTDFQAMRWSDVLRVKAEFPINLWPAGAAAYYRWIHEAVRTNKPYDKFVRELLLSDGSNFRNGAVNFWRAVPVKDADMLAETAAQTFLGKEQVSQWLTPFFSRVGYKATAEWKEEIIYWTHKPLNNPNVIFPDGTKGTVPDGIDPRAVLADWLVSPKNNEFNQCVVNRVWSWLCGTENSVSRPLSGKLCQELVESKYDLKHLYRFIANSEEYQSTAYPVRRIEAEVLQDALAKIFNVQISYTSEVPEPYTYIPARCRTVMLADASVTSMFLETFGRSSRDTGLDSDRNNDITESQELFLLNSTEVNSWISKYAQRLIGNWKRFEGNKVINEIYLTFLSRYPTDKELDIIKKQFSRSAVPPMQTMQDIIWALLNTKEFLCKH
ncbi:MAG: DUF1549 domain-containing protein [Planctomycetaceae bacterium]|jgi:hypothetical protein|nr:DUF1549 domain-containing protein [Planctomycetaceae bacterium]